MGAVKWVDEGTKCGPGTASWPPGRSSTGGSTSSCKEAVGLSHPQYEILVRLAAAPDGGSCG